MYRNIRIFLICLILLFSSLLFNPICLSSSDIDNIESFADSNSSLPVQSGEIRVSKPVGSGPHSTSYVSVDIPRNNDSPIPARVYYPSSGSGVATTGAPYTGIAFAPGAGGYETSYQSTLSTIASWGFIIAIVGTGGPCNQAVVDIQSDVLNYFEELNANSSSIFYNKIDSTGYGTSGHSNGGWAAIAGAIADARFQAVCPLAAAAGPGHDTGQANTRNLYVPLQLVTGANDHTFIPSADAYYNNANPIKSYMKITGSGHGGPFKLEYLVSFFKFWLDDEDEYSTFIYGDELQKDIVNNVIQYTCDYGLSPDISVSYKNVDEDENIVFTGGGTIVYPTGPDRSIVLYEWDFDEDGVYDWESDKEEGATYYYSVAGSYVPKFRLTDSWGLFATSEITITVTNKKPTAEAGANRIVSEDETVTFDASDSSDTASDISSLMFYWDFGDNNHTTWDYTPTAEHIYSRSENYTVRLHVKDDDEAVDIDIMKVSVLNLKPKAVIYTKKTTLKIGETITLSANQSSDTYSDISTLSYSWDFGDKSSATGEQVSHKYTDDGKFLITLTVTDDDGDIDIDDLAIIVLNSPPTCEAMKDIGIEEDDIVELTGDGWDTESDLDSLKYSWNLDEFGIPNTPWANTAEFECMFTNAGVYNATLMVRDDNGDIGNDIVKITVKNVVPNAKFKVSSAKVLEDERINFDASFSTDSLSDLDSLNYSWDFDDGSFVKFGKVHNHIFDKTGKYEVILTVTDDNGDSDTFSKTIEVENRVPTTKILASHTNVNIGMAISFSAVESSDTVSDLSDLNYSWSFDDKDKTTKYGKIVKHKYEFPGKYKVTLTVRDDDGSSSFDEAVIRIKDADDEETEVEKESTQDEGALMVMGVVNVVLVLLLIVMLLFYFLKKKK